MAKIVNVGTVKADLTNISKTKINKYKIGLLVKDGWKVQSKTKVIDVFYKKQYRDNIIDFVDYLIGEDYRGGVWYDDKKDVIVIGQGGSKISVNFKEEKPVVDSGRKRSGVPPRIQERGTTVVLNQALHNNKKFNKEEDIMADKDTADKLREVFKDYPDQLDKWIHSYYEQQKEFLKKYGNDKWDEFVYGNQSFVKFFEKNLINVARSFNPTVEVGRYETWNPSDIWAVYDMPKVKREILKNITPKKQSLIELNNLLSNLLEDKRLVGLSLKQIRKDKDAHFQYINVNAKINKVLEKDPFPDIERYTMKDIRLLVDNIYDGIKITTYVKYGPGNDYIVNVNNASHKRGTNLSFNTQIKASPAAQGGQAPLKMVQDLLRSKGNTTFVDDWKKFPQDAQEFSKESDKYEKMYNLVKNHMNNPPSYKEFEKRIDNFYVENKKFIAISKLMHLYWWYDSINNYINDAEYWTDLLYLGLKVNKRLGGFAPHGKIA